VRVTPGAREEILAVVDGKLLAKVRARPADGAANAAVSTLLARTLGGAEDLARTVARRDFAREGGSGRRVIVGAFDPPGGDRQH
jgi:hypothetical protein